MPPSKTTTGKAQKAKKLVQPGYAGLLSLREARDILAQISRSARVRKAWGFPQRQQSYSLGLIAERAYPEDHKAARAHIQSQLAEEKDKAGAPAEQRQAEKSIAPRKPAKLSPKASPAVKPKTKARRAFAAPDAPPSVTPRRAALAASPKPPAPRPTQLPRTPATRHRPAPRRVPA